MKSFSISICAIVDMTVAAPFFNHANAGINSWTIEGPDGGPATVVQYLPGKAKTQ